MSVITTKLIKVGNSKGIIIPKTMINEVGLEASSIRIESDGKKLFVIPSENKPRKGWANAFKKMKVAKHDKPAIPDFFEDEINADWKW
jgi:antitoxin MazE